ncbi:MAG: SRPBCC family protein [Actinomycetes bacterium]
MASTTGSGAAVVTLPSDTRILVTREFAAPRHLVWRAFTTPDLVERWWSGGKGEITLVEMDLRVGGRWRHVLRTDDGTEVGFHGEYREVVAPQRVVCTEVYEGIPEGEDEPALCTYVFSEADGRTTLTLAIDMSSKEGRDAMLASGMETGMQAQYDLLEELARSLR